MIEVNLGQYIKKLRGDKGWAQATLVKKLEEIGIEITTPYISEIEKGKIPSNRVIRGLARVFAPSPADEEHLRKELLALAWLEREEFPPELRDALIQGLQTPRVPLPQSSVEIAQMLASLPRVVFAGRIIHRLGEHPVEKRRLARFIAEEVPSQAKIFLESGTTLAFVAQELAERRREVNVFTNNVLAIVYLLPIVIPVEILGGCVNYEYGAILGEQAESRAEEIVKEGDVLTFLGVTAISWEHGLCAKDENHRQFKKIIIERAAKLIIVVGSPKFSTKDYDKYPVDKDKWLERRVDINTLIITTLPEDWQARREFWEALQPFKQGGSSLLPYFSHFLRGKTEGGGCCLIILEESGKPISSWEEFDRLCGLKRLKSKGAQKEENL